MTANDHGKIQSAISCNAGAKAVNPTHVVLAGLKKAHCLEFHEILKGLLSKKSLKSKKWQFYGFEFPLLKSA